MSAGAGLQGRGRGGIMRRSGPSESARAPVYAAELLVDVVPGASRDGPAGWFGDRVRLRVRQPPERGRANRAAEALTVAGPDRPERSIPVVSGERAPLGTLPVAGLDTSALVARIESRPDPG